MTPVRVNVNSTPSPSSTGLATGATATLGRGAATTAAVTALSTVSSVPPSSVKLASAFSVAPTSPTTTVYDTPVPTSVSAPPGATRSHRQTQVAPVSPSGSAMPEGSAVSVWPTTGVMSSINGAPVGAALSSSFTATVAVAGSPGTQAGSAPVSAVSDSVTEPCVSWMPSSVVATNTRIVALSAGKVAVPAPVAAPKSPEAATVQATSSVAAVSPVRVSVNIAALPSVTSPPEVTVTEGRGSAATAEVGALVNVAS